MPSHMLFISAMRQALLYWNTSVGPADYRISHLYDINMTFFSGQACDPKPSCFFFRKEKDLHLVI